MTAETASSATSVFDELANIAAELHRPQIEQRIADLIEYRRAAKLRLLVAGLPGSGRATLVNLLLGRPDLLPESPIPKPAAGLDLRHGERVSAIRVGPDESRTVVPAGQLRSLLAGPIGDRDRLEVRVPSELLELCDLRVESIEVGLGRSGWDTVLGGTDYVIFLLNATALLSDTERRFLREQLAALVGLERVAIVVTHMDLVPDEERESILKLVRTFLGPFDSQPAILGLSLRELTLGGATVAETTPLMTLLDDLLERRTPLRAAATRQTLSAIVDEMASAAEEIEALYSLEEDEVLRVQETIASQRDWLEDRIERMQRRVEAFVDTLLKEQLLRRVEAFGETLRARLPGEIEAVEDLSLIRRHLPGYLETVWTEFLRRQMIGVRADLAEEETRINAAIEADLREFLSGAAPAGAGLSRDLEHDPLALHVFVMPRRGKHRATNVARGLSLNGFIMLFMAPPVGIVSLAASQVIQRVFKADIARADRRAVIASAGPASKDLEGEIARRIQEQFVELTKQLKVDIAAAYREGLEQIGSMLDERGAHREDLETRRGEIRVIARQRLPRLRARLNQMRPGESP